jgi:hypothetical protein
LINSTYKTSTASIMSDLTERLTDVPKIRNKASVPASPMFNMARLERLWQGQSDSQTGKVNLTNCR